MRFKRLTTGRATLSNIEKSLVAGLGVYALILSPSLLLQGLRWAVLKDASPEIDDQLFLKAFLLISAW